MEISMKFSSKVFTFLANNRAEIHHLIVENLTGASNKVFILYLGEFNFVLFNFSSLHGKVQNEENNINISADNLSLDSVKNINNNVPTENKKEITSQDIGNEIRLEENNLSLNGENYTQNIENNLSTENKEQIILFQINVRKCFREI